MDEESSGEGTSALIQGAEKWSSKPLTEADGEGGGE